MWTRAELDRFLLVANEVFYRLTTGPGSEDKNLEDKKSNLSGSQKKICCFVFHQKFITRLRVAEAALRRGEGPNRDVKGIIYAVPNPCQWHH